MLLRGVYITKITDRVTRCEPSRQPRDRPIEMSIGSDSIANVASARARVPFLCFSRLTST